MHSNLILKLIRAGFSPALARTLIERMPQTGAPGRIAALVMQVAGAQFAHRCFRQQPSHDVGGVFASDRLDRGGQDTTAAKLAALCAQRHGAQNVGLITLDTYRVGAHEQLRFMAACSVSWPTWPMTKRP